MPDTRRYPSTGPEPDRGSRSRRPWWWYLIGVLLIVTLLVGAMMLVGGGKHGGIRSHRPPQANTGARTPAPGAENPSADPGSTRQLLKEPSGVLEQVTAKDQNDRTQVEQIRERLSAAAQRYRAGNFADPAVHSDIRPEMEGLARLKAGAARIRVDYQSLDDGAQVRLSSDDRSLVDLLHLWADMT